MPGHVAGIREVVADGTPIYATDLNQPVLTRLVDAPFTQHPDTLAKASKPAKFHWVSQKTTIGAGPNRIEIYPIRNASGARMLMLYLPEFHLLYSSDLVQPLGDGSFFWPEYLRELSDAVQREHLSVDRFFGMHATVSVDCDRAVPGQSYRRFGSSKQLAAQVTAYARFAHMRRTPNSDSLTAARKERFLRPARAYREKAGETLSLVASHS